LHYLAVWHAAISSLFSPLLPQSLTLSTQLIKAGNAIHTTISDFSFVKKNGDGQGARKPV
jgi:hypothetical protein